MADLSQIQSLFFEKVKDKLGSDFSLVHEVSEILEISYDSAYRRLRGEKNLSLNEAIKICQHFNISLNELAEVADNHFIFTSYPVEPGNFNFFSWLDFIISMLEKLSKASEKQIIYAAKDPPIFQYFQFPEIAFFKYFFWEKTLFHSQELKDKKFQISEIKEELIKKCNLISALSLKIPTIDIWNEDTFNILLRQIEYYWVSGYFNSKNDLEIVLDKIEIWLTHNQKEAEAGRKLAYNNTAKGLEGSYVLYENEIVINDNTIYVTIGNNCYTYLTYNVLGLLCSDNRRFCQYIHNFHKTIMSKSNLISSAGEKERNRFFNKLHQNIDLFRKVHNL